MSSNNLLVMGCGPIVVSIAAALLESGTSQFHMIITDYAMTDAKKLFNMVKYIRNIDDVLDVEEAIQPFHSVLYVSQVGNKEELCAVQSVCKKLKKSFLPAICIGNIGLAGPLIQPDDETSWESVWSSIHTTAFQKDIEKESVSSTGIAMLANVIAYEWYKTMEGVRHTGEEEYIYLLDLHTLEGSWHAVLPHPLVNGIMAAEWVHNLDPLEDDLLRSKEELHAFFDRITSQITGIFHRWEESDLKQLPLAQCYVQYVDPLSYGPADLLPEIVCNGFTHAEARREAGLTGVEGYYSRLSNFFAALLPTDQDGKKNYILQQSFISIGAGETNAEGVLRGIQHYLDRQLDKKILEQSVQVQPICMGAIEDKRCQFYLKALTIIQEAPALGISDNLAGFPVFWVGSDNRWYGSVGLNKTLALRKALQKALLEIQNKSSFRILSRVNASPIVLEEQRKDINMIPSIDTLSHADLLESTLQVLTQEHKELLLFALKLEPFVDKELAGVFGVVIREECYE